MTQDIMGNRIELGDTVVFGMAQSMTLLSGEVVKISAKTVMVKWWGRDRHGWSNDWKWLEAQRAFDDVVVVGRKDHQ